MSLHYRNSHLSCIYLSNPTTRINKEKMATFILQLLRRQFLKSHSDFLFEKLFQNTIDEIVKKHDFCSTNITAKCHFSN
jgi:hypothetical protein